VLAGDLPAEVAPGCSCVVAWQPDSATTHAAATASLQERRRRVA